MSYSWQQKDWPKYKPSEIARLPQVAEGRGCAPVKYFVIMIGAGQTPTVGGGGVVSVRQDLVTLWVAV